MMDDNFMERLRPLLDLLNQQEERMMNKMSDMHYDVKKINGRLRKTEKKVFWLEKNTERMTSKMREIKPEVINLGKIRYLICHPFRSAGIAIAIIFVIQLIVIEAYEKEWLSDLINIIKNVT